MNPNLKTISSTRSGLVVHSGSDNENSSHLSNSISLSFWISLFLAIIGLDLLGIHSCDGVSIVSFNIFVSSLSCLQNMASTAICICCRQRQLEKRKVKKCADENRDKGEIKKTKVIFAYQTQVSKK